MPQADLDAYCAVVSFAFLAFPSTFGFVRIVDLRSGGGHVFSHRPRDLAGCQNPIGTGIVQFQCVKGLRSSKKDQKCRIW